MKWSRDVLVCAIKQLELLYKQKQDPCLALMISRNYRLLHKQLQTVTEQKNCLDKAQIWQGQYRPGRRDKLVGIFSDVNSLSCDGI